MGEHCKQCACAPKGFTEEVHKLGRWLVRNFWEPMFNREVWSVGTGAPDYVRITLHNEDLSRQQAIAIAHALNSVDQEERHG